MRGSEGGAAQARSRSVGERGREGGQSNECAEWRRRVFALGSGKTPGPGSEVRRRRAAGRGLRIGKALPVLFGKSSQVSTSSPAERRAGVPPVSIYPYHFFKTGFHFTQVCTSSPAARRAGVPPVHLRRRRSLTMISYTPGGGSTFWFGPGISFSPIITVPDELHYPYIFLSESLMFSLIPSFLLS